MKTSKLAMPEVADEARWKRAILALRIREKRSTHRLDVLAAARRRLPMAKVAHDYRFKGPGGDKTLVELFEGRRQLIVYHFMYPAEWASPCPGCSRRMDDVGHLAHLHARDTSFVAVARAPYETLKRLEQRKGWTMPFYSAQGDRFNFDMGVLEDEEDDFGISVFFRDDENNVYRSYFTTGRGVEPAGFRALLDMTPYGRQEDWEDSPPGWPQSPTHGWGSDRDEA